MPPKFNAKTTDGVRPSAGEGAPGVGAPIPASQRWDAATKRSVFYLLLVALVFALWLSRGVLSWIIIAAILAYLLNPLVDLMRRVRVPRTIATLIVFAIMLAILILLPLFLIPVLIEQLGQLAAFDVGGTATSLFNWVLGAINEVPGEVVVLGVVVPTGSVVAQLEEGFRQVTFVPTLAEVLNYMQQAITTATGIVSSTAALSVAVVGRVIQGLLAFIVVFFLSLYMTKDFHRIRQYVEGLFPSSYQPELRELFRRMGFVWSSFFRGQIILSMAVGLVTWLALTLVGMPGALVLAIVAAVLEVAPNIGPIIATIPAVIVALLQGSTVLAQYGVGNVSFALITIGIYFLIQQAEGNFLVPRIIGESVNLHPVVVIIGVAVGFDAFGVLGAFLAAPTLATMRLIGSYLHAKLLDYPPFQRDEAAPPLSRPAYHLHVTGEQLASEASRPVPALTPEAAQAPGAPSEGSPAGAVESGERPATGSASVETPRISSSPAQ